MNYNADAEAIGLSQIEIQVILYRNGEEFQRGDPGSPAFLGCNFMPRTWFFVDTI